MKMISLNVEQYCHHCPYFQPIKRETFYADERIYETTVKCENEEICQEIYRYIKSQMCNEK